MTGLHHDARFTWRLNGVSIHSTIAVVDAPHELTWTGKFWLFKAVDRQVLEQIDGGRTRATVEESLTGPLLPLLYSNSKLRLNHARWLTSLKGFVEQRVPSNLRVLFSPTADPGSQAPLRTSPSVRARVRLGQHPHRDEYSAAGLLSERDRSESEVPAGTPDGPFRVLYRFRNEELTEIRNATVQGYVCTAQTPTATGYRLFLAAYVLSVSWLTRP
jgi:hypothetical protein